VVFFPTESLFLFLVALGFVVTASLLIRAGFSRAWHAVALPTIAAYILLNFGFANLTLRVAGFSILVGHVLMLAGLVLAIRSSKNAVTRELRDPAMLSLLALMCFSTIHLTTDVAVNGMYAIRDSSLFFEGIFLLLGLLWAREEGVVDVLGRWLLPVFLLNFCYSLTLPWRETLQSWSPVSGFFRPVPIFGYYNDNYLYLLAGALFFLWWGAYVVRWPGWVRGLLAAGQILCLTIVQTRSMYVGIVVVLLVVVLLGEFRKWVKIAVSSFSTLVVFVVLTSYMGLELQGRVGPVQLSFLGEHVRSLTGAAGTPGTRVEGRMRWYQEAWDRARSSSANFLIGEGFGEPLLDNTLSKEGVPVRQPHNTFLSVLARLGVVGAAVWGIFHLTMVVRFVRILRRRRWLEPRFYEVILWFFLYYLLSMIVTSVQPHLEFSYGAIPFYVLMGLALGLMRRTAEETRCGEQAS
jgi:O-antigen ligase